MLIRRGTEAPGREWLEIENDETGRVVHFFKHLDVDPAWMVERAIQGEDFDDGGADCCSWEVSDSLDWLLAPATPGEPQP